MASGSTGFVPFGGWPLPRKGAILCRHRNSCHAQSGGRPVKPAVIIVRSLMGLMFLFASITYFFKLITPPLLAYANRERYRELFKA